MTNHSFPPLEELIQDINRQIDAYPDSYSQQEHESVAKDQHPIHKRRGNQFIRFTVSQTQFALPLKYALEILPKPSVTPLPNLPGWILGICNVRGEIVSVVELCLLLGLKRMAVTNGSYLILLQIGQLKVGLIVDKIGGIFFDEDPDNAIESKHLSDKTFAQFAKSTFVADNYDVHLLEISKLVPALTAF